ncbi:MAG: hypothetical protein OXF97_06590 [Nitrospira sp.]|nr:hypothetical protein [Nitrospira sp.]MCY3954395.1 hypothetical protein [Nitrospira sp.]MCY4131199.1 hypothetical protein [Nitrospira sp.]
MPESRADRTLREQDADQASLTIPVGLFAALIVAILALSGIGTRYYVHGDLNVIHALLSLFFSINLLICYWEVCLFIRRNHIETRAEYWRERRCETGRTPAFEFFVSKVSLTQVLSPTLWADVWAAYSQYDDSYADRRTFGYNADIVNGFVTPVPSLILYAAYTIDFLPALFAGILGVMVFWQWTYVTSVYWVSFFIAKRQTRISRHELYIYIFAINSFWVLCGLLGLYASINLIVDGNYSVLGY